jgi:hypothetical protein
MFLSALLVHAPSDNAHNVIGSLILCGVGEYTARVLYNRFRVDRRCDRSDGMFVLGS